MKDFWGSLWNLVEKLNLNSLNHPNFNPSFAILGGVIRKLCLLGGYFFPTTNRVIGKDKVFVEI